jgi:hypothetical protein
MAAVFVVALAVAGFAQGKADFSGTWTPEPAAEGGGGGRGMGGPMTVKQTATELSVERQGRNGAQTTTYKLDGDSEVAGRGGAMMKVSTKWDGSKLVITTHTDNGDQVQTWSLADGKLKIERTGGRGPSTTTYTKGS